MALDFPSPVSSGAIYTGTNGVTYYYDGIKWQGEIPVPTDLDTGLVQYFDDKIQNTTSNIVFVGDNNSATIIISNSGTITLPNGAVLKGVSGNGIAFGKLAGAVSQSAGATAIGYLAGYTNQSIEAVAVGDSAGQTTQGVNAVAVGAYSGRTNQGSNAIALGAYAGQTSQYPNSIVLNATGLVVNSASTSSFVVKPVRSVTTTTGLTQVWYSTSTGEFVYYTP